MQTDTVSMRPKGLVDLFSLGGQDTGRGSGVLWTCNCCSSLWARSFYLPLWSPIYYSFVLFVDMIIWVLSSLAQWDFVVAAFPDFINYFVELLNYWIIPVIHFAWVKTDIYIDIKQLKYLTFNFIHMSVLGWRVIIWWPLNITEQTPNCPLHFILCLLNQLHSHWPQL